MRIIQTPYYCQTIIKGGRDYRSDAKFRTRKGNARCFRVKFYGRFI
jgi:hypothetical protein